jgi:hypothetical protein
LISRFLGFSSNKKPLTANSEGLSYLMTNRGLQIL